MSPVNFVADTWEQECPAPSRRARVATTPACQASRAAIPASQETARQFERFSITAASTTCTQLSATARHRI